MLKAVSGAKKFNRDSCLELSEFISIHFYSIDEQWTT